MVQATKRAVKGFAYTTAIKSLRRLKKRFRVIPGGTSASKTYGVLAVLIDRCAKEPGLDVSVVSATLPHLKKGAIKDFRNIMAATGRWRADAWHDTDKRYTFRNGARIEFFSADSYDKVRGPRRDVLYLNEANLVNFQTFQELQVRTRREVWVDFNPVRRFWAHDELENDPRAEWLTLTYKDNEAAPPNVVEEIEEAKRKGDAGNAFWANWYKVYGLGQIGALEGVVFSNWGKCDRVPENARLLGYGMDFGYTNDPTAITAIYEHDGARYWDLVFYRKGAGVSEIAAVLKQAGATRKTKIAADSADPRTIAELNLRGFNIYPAVKGPDSILHGIELIQREEVFYISGRSGPLEKELVNYLWETDRDGNPLNRPCDAFNHAIDAARYFYQTFLSDQKRKRKGARRAN